MSTADVPGEPYVRELRPDELDAVVDMEVRAFLGDFVFNYGGNLRLSLHDTSQAHGRESLRRFLRFFTKVNMLRGARITVMAAPRAGGGAEELLACCIWALPGKRIDLWRVPTIIKSGIIPVVRRWGLTGVARLGFEYSDKAEKMMKTAFKTHGLKESPKRAVYLSLACTDPSAQGKGLISKLLREEFVHAPSETFTLEASSEKSRGVYAHVGYEVVKEFRVGTGKVNQFGLPPADGEEACGVLVWSMVKWKTS